MDNIFHVIEANYPQYTNADKKVASYILREKEGVTNMTLADIAEGAKVSEGSVIRFCNKLGIKKLIDLKICIAKISAKENERTDALGSALENEFAEIIHNTASLISPAQIEQAVDLIEQRRHIYFFGISVSGIAARMGENSFLRMGKSSQAIEEGHMQMLTASAMSADNALVVFSLTGNTKDTCEAAAAAKLRGVKIISITSYRNSQLAKISDIVLQTSAKEEIINGGRITGLISQMFVLDHLKREYTARHSEVVSQLKEDLAKTILLKKL